MQVHIELSEWMKRKLRSGSKLYLGITMPSRAWLQTASLKALNNTMVPFCIILYDGLQFCLFSLHAPSTKMLHRNKSKIHQNIPDAQTSHVAGLTNRERRGMEGWLPLPNRMIQNARSSNKCTRNVPSAMFCDANFMWSGQSALRCTSVQCWPWTGEGGRQGGSCTYVGIRLQFETYISWETKSTAGPLVHQ